MSRHLRHPLPTAEFNRLALRVTRHRFQAPWWNLRWEHRIPPAGDLLSVSASGRLTPVSEKVPCLYLARNRETSFYELFGDDVDVAEKAGDRLAVSRATLERKVYLKTAADFEVNVYDLTAERSAKKIGMDLHSLYTADVGYPRTFAQRLHDHPHKFDGIQYVSRHTQCRCLVLWATHTSTLSALPIERGVSLWDLCSFDPKDPPGTLKLFGSLIDGAATPGTPP